MLLLLNLAAAAAIATIAPVHRDSPAAVATRARTNLAALMSDSDYPAEAFRKGEQGTVSISLGVSAEGTVTSCNIVGSSGSVSLDNTTCKLITERARYTPARDRKGRAVADTMQARITWALPDLRLVERTDVWEVIGTGEQRSCRRELRYSDGSIRHDEVCSPIVTEAQAAASFIRAGPEEVITITFKISVEIDVVQPFAKPDDSMGVLLKRGIGLLALDTQGGVNTCEEQLQFSRLPGSLEPCAASNIQEWVVPGTTRARVDFQYFARKGVDDRRPAILPSEQQPSGRLSALDPNQQVKSARASWSQSIYSYFGAKDYPPEALAAGEHGWVTFKLSTDAEGKVAACRVISTSGSAALDATTCEILSRRARLRPARDESGRPVAGELTDRMRWVPPKTFEPTEAFVWMTLSADGTSSVCQWRNRHLARESSGDRDACDVPPWLLSDVAAQRPVAGARIRLHSRLIRDAAEPWPDLLQPTDRLIARQMVRLTVNEAGEVQSCTLVSSEGRALDDCPRIKAVEPGPGGAPPEVRFLSVVALEGADLPKR